MKTNLMKNYKFVVIENHTLGYIKSSEPETIYVLRSLVTKGGNNDWISLNSLGFKTRPANQKDFETFRVVITGYLNDGAEIPV